MRLFLTLLILLPSTIYAETQCRVIDNLLSTPLYKGKCVNGLANGYGVATDKKLAITYKGQFKNGRFNGSGTLTGTAKDNTKRIWKGIFFNGELNGYGTFSSREGTTKGQWKNGKLNGQALTEYSDGRQYKGQYKNNNWHGKGRLTFSDGTYIQGNWVNGKVSGFVIETMKNGAIYKGQYRNNKRNGKGQISFSDGTSTSGVWRNGKAVSGNVMKLINKPVYQRPQRPRYTNTVPSGGVVESTIDGDFEGWEGETIFKLMNGQIWQQSQYSYTYHYAFMPKVVIYPSNGRFKMKVDGVNSTIYVKQLK